MKVIRKVYELGWYPSQGQDYIGIGVHFFEENGRRNAHMIVGPSDVSDKEKLSHCLRAWETAPFYAELKELAFVALDDLEGTPTTWGKIYY